MVHVKVTHESIEREDGSNKSTRILARKTDYIAYPLDPQYKNDLNSSLRNHSDMPQDRHTWIIGLFAIQFTAVVAYRWPQHYWVLHIIKMVYYLPWRFWKRLKTNEEWSTIEFCYFPSYAMFVWCLYQFTRSMIFGADSYTAYNQAVIHAGFGFANGSLATAILLLGTKLVLHDRGELCSTFVHLSPAIVAWCLRWNALLPTQWREDTYPYMFDVCGDSSPTDVDDCSKLWCSNVCSPGSLFNFMRMAFITYAVWMVCHGLLMHVILKDYLERNNKQHLYKVARVRRPSLLKVTWAFASQYCGAQKDSVVVYYCTHFIGSMILVGCSWIFWHSFVLHTAWIMLLIYKCVSNGASYTFEIFAVRYACMKFKSLGYVGMAFGSQDEVVLQKVSTSESTLSVEPLWSLKNESRSSQSTAADSDGSSSSSLRSFLRIRKKHKQ